MSATQISNVPLENETMPSAVGPVGDFAVLPDDVVKYIFFNSMRYRDLYRYVVFFFFFVVIEIKYLTNPFQVALCM